MNKALTIIAVAIIVSGCSSTDYAMTPEDRHQAAKTQYYQQLNQRETIETVARNEDEGEQ